jgi:hypothetical protein
MQENLITKIISSVSGNAIESIGKAVDSLTTSKEEKLTLANELERIHSESLNKALETAFLEAQSARDREVKINESNTNWLVKSTPSLIALSYLSISLVLDIVSIFTNVIPPNKKEIMTVVLTGTNSASFLILSYYYGASHQNNQSNKN